MGYLNQNTCRRGWNHLLQEMTVTQASSMLLKFPATPQRTQRKHWNFSAPLRRENERLLILRQAQNHSR